MAKPIIMGCISSAIILPVSVVDMLSILVLTVYISFSDYAGGINKLLYISPCMSSLEIFEILKYFIAGRLKNHSSIC